MEDSGPVFYEVSGNSRNEYDRLGRIVSGMQMRGGCYFDHTERYIYGIESTKGNAGASKLLSRDVMEVGNMVSLHFHLNFLPVTFQFTTGRVHFLPDQMVVVNLSSSCQFVGYDEITITFEEATHMNVPVPAWSQPVGYSWQFMNRDGGPDRRYNVNPQIPHYKVWEVDLQYPGGRLDTAFADGDLAGQFVDCLKSMKSLSLSRSARR
jgi:DNA polymerase-3 subunit epsilon